MKTIMLSLCIATAGLLHVSCEDSAAVSEIDAATTQRISDLREVERLKREINSIEAITLKYATERLERAEADFLAADGNRRELELLDVKDARDDVKAAKEEIRHRERRIRELKDH